MYKRFVSCLTLFIFASAVFCGCGSKLSGITSDNNDKTSLKWWCTNSASAYVSNLGEVESYKKLQDKFNMDIEFIHPVADRATEQFTVMIASGEYADIIDFNWLSYPGGPSKAAEDGIIVYLDDYIKKYAPNLTKVIDRKPAVAAAVKNYDGKITVLPSVQEDMSMLACYGPIIRQDWLDTLGLSVPKTIDDWYNMLVAFRDKDPNRNGIRDEIPFISGKASTFLYFQGAWRLSSSFMVNEDGKVVFGLMEPNYKDFLATMHKWYEEKLIDNEYITMTNQNVEAKMTSDLCGAWMGYSGSNIGKMMEINKSSNPKFELVGAPWPVGPAGVPHTAYEYQAKPSIAGKGLAITVNNKQPEKCIKMLDYLFTEEGSALMCWGIEGVTYEKKEDGYAFTDLVLKSPEGKSPVEALAPYALPLWGMGGSLMRKDAFDVIAYGIKEQRQANEVWAQGDISHILPSLTYSSEEMEVITDVMTDIYSYRSEFLDKVIMGVEPITKYDEVVQNIKNMGIEKAIKINQTAYDRYMRR